MKQHETWSLEQGASEEDVHPSDLALKKLRGALTSVGAIHELPRQAVETAARKAETTERTIRERSEEACRVAMKKALGRFYRKTAPTLPEPTVQGAEEVHPESDSFKKSLYG